MYRLNSQLKTITKFRKVEVKNYGKTNRKRFYAGKRHLKILPFAPFSILLAIEFGAGVHFNPTKNPLVGSKFPYGVGTFPGQTHAYDDMWWYWNEKEQKWMPTHGVKATMPMYKAGKDIRSKIIKTAKEIF